MGPPEHPKWRGAICSNTGTPKVPFSAEIPLVNPSLTKGQNPHKTCFMVLYQTRAPPRASPNQKKKDFSGSCSLPGCFLHIFLLSRKTHKKHIKTSWFLLLHQKYKVLFLYPIFFSLVLYLGFGVQGCGYSFLATIHTSKFINLFLAYILLFYALITWFIAFLSMFLVLSYS